MRKLVFVGLVAAVLLLAVPVSANSGQGWVQYGNVMVYWELADCDGDDVDDGYQYWWGVDRNLNGEVGDGPVWVDYGKYGGLQLKDEPCYEHECYTDFDCYVGLDYFDEKVIHLTEGWVTGVTVPGGVNRFVAKDNDGDGIYTGGFSTILFWDGLTQQGDPPGPYNIRNVFDYEFDATGPDGMVVGGHYVQEQYMMIPDDAG
jgi:hypothetical protein